MKRIFVIIMIIATGCSNHKNKMAGAPHHFRTESAINDLVDSFKSDYASATTISAKETVLSGYQLKTDKFLSKHYLNHMRVHIDSVIINRLKINTKFHAGRN